jgi:hypothetical protein
VLNSFFNEAFWQGTAGGVISGLIVVAIMSATTVALLKRLTGLKEIVAPWLLFTALYFAIVFAYSLAQQRFYVPEIWPPALSKTEIQNWITALQPYHTRVSEVMVCFVDEGQKDFAASVAEALTDADWPEPSLQPNNMLVGVHVTAAKDVYDVGEELQKLLQNKVGKARLDKAERATMNPDEKSKTVPPGKIQIYVGWRPPT